MDGILPEVNGVIIHCSSIIQLTKQSLEVVKKQHETDCSELRLQFVVKTIMVWDCCLGAWLGFPVQVKLTPNVTANQDNFDNLMTRTMKEQCANTSP